MSGSLGVAIVTPIVALLVLGMWLGGVYWADAHPAVKAHRAAAGTEISDGTSLPGQGTQVLGHEAAHLTESGSPPVGDGTPADAGGRDDRELVPSAAKRVA